MNTLAKSGALYRLHKKRGSLRLAVDFYERRLRHLRKSIRRQKRVVFLLRLRRWWNSGPGVTECQSFPGYRVRSLPPRFYAPRFNPSTSPQ